MAPDKVLLTWPGASTYTGVMMPTRNKAEWRAQYRETTELLETLRARELKNMTDERARQIIESLGAFEEPWRERTDWSGLVEQQAFFHRRKQP